MAEAHEKPKKHPVEASRENRFIAEKLDEVADLLQQQGANLFRVRAYREAAQAVSLMQSPVAGVLAEDGRTGLEALPAIGESITAAIQEILETGDLVMIKRLRGSLDPEKLFQSIPGVGPKLAEQIHDQLGIETLEALEVAAHSGQLREIPGMGSRRVRGIQHSLAEILARRRPFRPRQERPFPSINTILDVDEEYRKRAAAKDLPFITPKRFNPAGKAWLPILHTQRDDWHFTALFSNTALSHQLKRTQDWVVIYYERDNEPEGQCTVVFEKRGPLAGKRVIRGHERACAEYYSSRAG